MISQPLKVRQFGPDVSGVLGNSNTANGGTMYSLIPRRSLLRFSLREGVPGVLALIVAEVFYKFHSFTLECVAFLATWFALSFVLSLIMPGRVSREQS